MIDKQGEVIVSARGESLGTITMVIESPIKSGIPLSSVFKADGCDKVNSALTIEEKNNISHRGKALKIIRKYFENNI